MELTEAELKIKIKEATEAAVAEAVEGLKAKNIELLGKLKKAQKDSTIDPADHAALQTELDTTQKKLTEALKVVKTTTTESEKIKKQYETESKVAHNLLVENGLTQALVSAKVKPELMKAAKAMLSGSVVLIADGENRVAKIGDKLLADAVTEWAKGEEGKHFVSAPNNTGGNAPGGGGDGGNKKEMTRAAFEALDPVEKMTFTKAGGHLTA